MYDNSFFDTAKGQALVNNLIRATESITKRRQYSVYCRTELDNYQSTIDKNLKNGARLVHVLDVADHPGKILIFEIED